MGAQARLHMPDRDPLVKTADRADHGRRRIALHEQTGRIELAERLFHAEEQTPGKPVERLSGRHKRQIRVGDDPEILQRRSQHLPVLPCCTDDGSKST